MGNYIPLDDVISKGIKDFSDKYSVQNDKIILLDTTVALDVFGKGINHERVKDSIEITDNQVEEELDKRLRIYIGQFGSVQALESYLGKSMEKFKEESRDDLRQVLLVQKMQATITDGITVSPSEIKDFYDGIPKDSIPLINAEIEVGRIIKTPQVDPELKRYAKDKIESIREDIIAGKKDFATAAIINSMDPGSAPQGGLYKNVQRGTFDPEFDAVAFSSKEKEVSTVFETRFGFHILMVEARRGEEDRKSTRLNSSH